MDRKECPYCGEEIAVNAKKCRFCGEWLEEIDTQAKEVSKSQTNNNINQRAKGINRPISMAQRVRNDDNPIKKVKEPASSGFFETYFIDTLIRKYTNFSGITSRKEFWLTCVAMAIIYFGIEGLCMLIIGCGGSGGLVVGVVISGLLVLALLLPTLAISCRRLRDAGFSPWFVLVSLIPGIGGLVLLVMYCLPSKYNHNSYSTQFSSIDFIIIGVCPILCGIGIWSIIQHPIDDSDPKEHKALYEISETGEYVSPVVEIVDYSYDDTIPDTYSNTEKSYSSDADESLFDLLLMPEAVITGETKLVPLRIGKNYDKVFTQTGSTHISLNGSGMISRSEIFLKCFLTEDGELHGRYHNYTNNISLDVNGYILPDGNLYIQLGHDSEKSEWFLHPVSDELPNTYRYEGVWGKQNKWSYIVFTEDSE